MENTNSYRNVSRIMGSQKNSAKLDSALHLEHGWNSSWCTETLHKGRDKQSHSYTVRLTLSLRGAWWVLKEDSATAPQPTPSIHTSSAYTHCDDCHSLKSTRRVARSYSFQGTLGFCNCALSSLTPFIFYRPCSA